MSDADERALRHAILTSPDDITAFRRWHALLVRTGGHRATAAEMVELGLRLLAKRLGAQRHQDRANHRRTYSTRDRVDAVIEAGRIRIDMARETWLRALRRDAEARGFWDRPNGVELYLDDIGRTWGFRPSPPGRDDVVMKLLEWSRSILREWYANHFRRTVERVRNRGERMREIAATQMQQAEDPWAVLDEEDHDQQPVGEETVTWVPGRPVGPQP